MLEHEFLYGKPVNRCLSESAGLIPTTLIWGAKCSDGVVMVGDRKVTSGLGDNYIDKIRRCGNIGWAIFGAAGIATLFEEFLTILPQKMNTHANWINYQNQRLLNQHNQDFQNNPNSIQPPRMDYTAEDFKQDCVELLTEMRNRYSIAFTDPSCCLYVLIGIAVNNDNPKLYYLDSVHCLPAEVNELVPIGQSQLSEVFRKAWDRSMTMEQTAKLGMLAIKYIEQERISDGIGVGQQQPQIWLIPNRQQPREILGDELTAMVGSVDPQVAALQNQLHSLFRS